MSGGAPRDLVTASYLLNELPEAARPRLIERLWQATAGVLVIVEPGTPAGYSRILAARDALIRHGANVIAPCPHAQACPLVAPDWCHFAARVARSRRHRLAKAATVPWEDEKFSYVALAREPNASAPGLSAPGPAASPDAPEGLARASSPARARAAAASR